jgi:hypothetical protein
MTSQRLTRLFPRKIITPVTAVFALVICITGGMLFFHFGESLIKETHEWLGMLFVLAISIHLATNWTAFTKHLRHNTAKTALLSTLLIAMLFLGLTAENRQEGGAGMVFRAMENAPVSSLAVLFDVDEAALVRGLQDNGLVLGNHEQSLTSAASTVGIENRRAIQSLLQTVRALNN